MNLETRLFAELTQPEIKEQLQVNPLVLFPTGSVEQHSAHLPANTDTIAATTVCELVAKKNGWSCASCSICRCHTDAHAL